MGETLGGGSCAGYLTVECMNDIVWTAGEELRERVQNGTWKGDCKEVVTGVPGTCDRYLEDLGWTEEFRRWNTSYSSGQFSFI